MNNLHLYVALADDEKPEPPIWGAIYDYLADELKIHFSGAKPKNREDLIRAIVVAVRGSPQKKIFITIPNLLSCLKPPEPLSQDEIIGILELLKQPSLECIAWMTLGEYWQWEHSQLDDSRKPQHEIFSLFGKPEFLTPDTPNPPNSNYYPKGNQKLKNLEEKYNTDSCNKECQDKLSKDNTLIAILNDLSKMVADQNDACTLLIKLARGKNWSQVEARGKVARLLSKVGLVQEVPQEVDGKDVRKWRITFKTLEVALCMKDACCLWKKGWMISWKSIEETIRRHLQPLTSPEMIWGLLILSLVFFIGGVLSSGSAIVWNGIRCSIYFYLIIALMIGHVLLQSDTLRTGSLPTGPFANEIWNNIWSTQKIFPVAIALIAWFLLLALAEMPRWEGEITWQSDYTENLSISNTEISLIYSDWIFNDDEVILQFTPKREPEKICPTKPPESTPTPLPNYRNNNQGIVTPTATPSPEIDFSPSLEVKPQEDSEVWFAWKADEDIAFHGRLGQNDSTKFGMLNLHASIICSNENTGVIQDLPEIPVLLLPFRLRGDLHDKALFSLGGLVWFISVFTPILSGGYKNGYKYLLGGWIIVSVLMGIFLFISYFA